MAKSRQQGKKVTVSAIRGLSQLQVTETEAAAALGVRPKTFREMLRVDAAARDAWEQGRELGRVSLRRAQFMMAHKNPQMAIFLGKQYLGQNEISVIEHSGRDGGPIKTLDLNRLDRDGRKQLRTILEQARVKK